MDPSKPDGAPYKTVDGSRGARHFGWSPQRDFKQGVAEAIQWYLEQGAQTEYFTSGPYTHYSIQQITNNNGAIEASTFADNQATTYGYSTTSSIFNKINYGINLGFGVSKKLNDRLNIKLGCTIEYDFSNAEDFSATLSKINTTTLDYYRFNSRILHTYSSKERKSTHNIYYGFGFSFAWYLRRQSY